tara:strand:+ start:673 stop:831 length:159 start_codon:yes stop_codon:yes gene_type:complete
MAKKSALRTRIVKEYKKATKFAVREPRTIKEIASRMRWERLDKILRGRYDYL